MKEKKTNIKRTLYRGISTLKSDSKNRGITLVALVVTIVILLILAGISISAISGENGIFSKAQRATEEHTKAQLEEELQLEIQNIQIDKISKGKQMQREDLNELNKIGAIVESTGIPAIGEYGDYVFEVDEKYKVTIGSKLEGEKPIGNAEIIEDEITGEIQIKVTASTIDGNIVNIEATNGAVLKTDTSATEKIFEVVKAGNYYFKITASNGRIAIVSAKIENRKITEITLNKTSTAIVLNGTETLKVTITPNNATNKNITWTSSDESIATVENGIIIAKKVGITTITATAQDGSEKSASCEVKISSTLAELVKPGDYVEYDGGNGYTGLWQVLYNDSTYGLQIISANTVTDSFSLGGTTETAAKASYNSAIDTLNAECRKYVNGSYATSGRCVGSNPLSPNDATTATVTLKFKYNNTSASGCKVADSNYNTDYNAMKVATNQNDAGIHILGKKYWLASRNVYSIDSIAIFSIMGVGENGKDTAYYMWLVDTEAETNKYKPSNGLRPVITLISNIQTSSGNGSVDYAFKLVSK